MLPFADRIEAGQMLAELLHDYAHRPDVIVLALPRGGVPVGYEIAQRLDAPLDVFLVRKLGMPGHEEFAIGAIASGGVRVLNEQARSLARIPESMIDAVAEKETAELHRRERMYRGSAPPPDFYGKTCILVDDGLATGSTMRAAVAGLRQHHPAKIIVAVPVASVEACQALKREADEVVCAAMPEPFYAVGQWYQEFGQTSDQEVQELLDRAHSFSEVSNAS
jgi:putative phosphoribosyl transferase